MPDRSHTWITAGATLLAGVIGATAALFAAHMGKLPSSLVPPAAQATATVTTTATVTSTPKPSVNSNDQSGDGMAVGSLALYDSDLTVTSAGGGRVAINGVDYSQGLYTGLASCTGPDWTALWAYDLGRDYSRLTAVAGVLDQSSSDTVMEFRVLLDGKSTPTSKLTLGEQMSYDLDVTGVLRVEFQLTATRDLCGSLSDSKDFGGFGNPSVS